MRKRIRQGLAGCLIAALLLAAVPAGSVQAGTLEDSIKEKQEAISQAEQEKKKLQSSISNIKAMVKDLEKSKSDLETYVKELDGKLADIGAKIDELQKQIAQKKEEIAQAKADLEKAQEVADQQYTDMKKRLRFLYQNSKGSGYLELLVSAESFADMLNQAEYVEQLSAYDSQKLEEYRQSVEYMKLCKQTLEEEEEVLASAQASLEQEQKAVDTLIGEKEQQIQAFQGDINNKEAALKEYEAVAADKAKLAEQNRIKYDGGMFQMPCPGYKRVSSDYGTRMHPTLGVQKFHNGVDFAAASGTPILAAYSGNVVAASYNSSMGNYVMIDHGDGLYTIYMHASKLYVSSGQSVSKGDQIAAVGSTGRSTGPHLHFSVRLNGNYVSPWGYLK